MEIILEYFVMVAGKSALWSFGAICLWRGFRAMWHGKRAARSLDKRWYEENHFRSTDISKVFPGWSALTYLSAYKKERARLARKAEWRTEFIPSGDERFVGIRQTNPVSGETISSSIMRKGYNFAEKYRDLARAKKAGDWEKVTQLTEELGEKVEVLKNKT